VEHGAHFLILYYPPTLNNTTRLQAGIFDAVRRGQFDTTNAPWNKISKSAKELVHGLLNSNAKTRMTAQEALRCATPPPANASIGLVRDGSAGWPSPSSHGSCCGDAPVLAGAGAGKRNPTSYPSQGRARPLTARAAATLELENETLYLKP
jgi:hypothetical protein